MINCDVMVVMLLVDAKVEVELIVVVEMETVVNGNRLVFMVDIVVVAIIVEYVVVSC